VKIKIGRYMDINNIYNTFFMILIVFGLMLVACSEPKQDAELNSITNPQFTYHQDTNKLYFGVNVEKRNDGVQIDSVYAYWYGPNKLGSADFVKLNDTGNNGDILSGDFLFARKITNDPSLVNTLTDNDSIAFIEYVAFFGSTSISLLDSSTIGNIIPKIVNLIVPDTIFRPLGNTISLIPIKAEVSDADGRETIKWVGFTSYSLTDSTIMNDGNLIYLYNDGSSVILYPPNFTSGDETKLDDIYTFKIPIYGTGYIGSDSTRTGVFRWRFSAQDLANDYSKNVDHVIVIE